MQGGGGKCVEKLAPRPTKPHWQQKSKQYSINRINKGRGRRWWRHNTCKRKATTMLVPPLSHTHTHTHACTHTHAHTRTHARTHAHPLLFLFFFWLGHLHWLLCQSGKERVRLSTPLHEDTRQGMRLWVIEGGPERSRFMSLGKAEDGREACRQLLLVLHGREVVAQCFSQAHSGVLGQQLPEQIIAFGGSSKLRDLSQFFCTQSANPATLFQDSLQLFFIHSPQY